MRNSFVLGMFVVVMFVFLVWFGFAGARLLSPDHATEVAPRPAPLFEG